MSFSLHVSLFKVKPARAGSSIGVKVAFGVKDSIKKAVELILEVSVVLERGLSLDKNLEVEERKYFISGISLLQVCLFSSAVLQGIDDRVVVEVFIEDGHEFTAIVLDVGSGSDSRPVVLLPSEVITFSVVF